MIWGKDDLDDNGGPRLEKVNTPSDADECDIQGKEKEKSEIVSEKEIFYPLKKWNFQFLEKGAQYRENRVYRDQRNERNTKITQSIKCHIFYQNDYQQSIRRKI